LVVEILVVWMVVLPRRFRIICFFIVTGLQTGILLTANYAFLNYLVLALGILLLDDRFLLRFVPARWASSVRDNLQKVSSVVRKEEFVELDLRSAFSKDLPSAEIVPNAESESSSLATWAGRWREFTSVAGLWLSGFVLAWMLYANLFLVLRQIHRDLPLPGWPVAVLEPFRIANSYGLFGRMTWKRYEIEFQGSNDGTNWIPYPFRNKPQDPAEAPRIYAPYQPRFDWNLWFASLDTWRDNEWVVRTEQLLLADDADVLSLYAANPFPQAPPKQVRAVLWQYWFTDVATKRATHMWWRREYLRLYAPSLERGPDGRIMVSAWPEAARDLP